MQPSEESALLLYQSHRETDRVMLGAMIDECLQPGWYTALISEIREAVSEPEFVESCVSKKSITTPLSSLSLSDRFSLEF